MPADSQQKSFKPFGDINRTLKRNLGKGKVTLPYMPLSNIPGVQASASHQLQPSSLNF
jgi:hypothetical protein